MIEKSRRYQIAVTQSDNINTLSREMEVLIREMQRIISDTSIAWKGEAANAFIGKCEELKQEIETTSKDMIQLEGLIKNYANNNLK